MFRNQKYKTKPSLQFSPSGGEGGRAWHSLPLADILRTLQSDPKLGLSQSEIAARQSAYGRNILPRGKKVTALQMIGRQFTSPLVYILLVAAALSAAVRELADTIVILIVVAVNAAIGFFQDFRANNIFEKLKSVVRVEALVTRAGKLQAMDSEELVPGDIITLKGGSKVPADARLIAASNLQANEALLTGESRPVDKTPGVAEAAALVGDRSGMVFMGTVLEQGDGAAVVVATGARTEIGQISLMAQNAEEEATPLQVRMGKLGKFLTELFLVISAAIFLIGLLEGDGFVEILTTTIAVAVAAIPEGLPAAISVILAVASQKIFRRRGLVMRLAAAETLGSTSVICADKTGTLTHGQMRVEEILAPDRGRALLCMALANEAVIEEKDGKKIARGEATDKAKLEEFLRGGGNLEKALADLPRLALLQFDPGRKYLASFHEDKKSARVFVSGAPERILELSNLPAAKKTELTKTFEDLSARGFRLIGLAEKPLSKTSKLPEKADSQAKLIRDLDYLGLAAIRDPIREDVREALAVTRRAGIRVIMITGDHALTARAIGAELGFAAGPAALITGAELDEMSDDDLRGRVGPFEIVARATPAHKMRIIDAWQKLGAVIAMTGDGVNDAPALKAANIGVAVGSGTDVAKESADLILLDDGFGAMTAAVEEGRAGFANIRKATITVMSNAFTEIMLILSSLIFFTPLPITAVQILWVNLAEDALPVLALAFEPPEAGVMNRKPLGRQEPILDREAKIIIFAVGLVMDAMLAGIFLWLLKFSGWPITKIQTFVFVATAVPTLINIFAFKSLRQPLLRTNLLNNRFLLLAVAVGFGLMIGAVYLPPLNDFLGTTALPGAVLAGILAFALVKLALVEFTKWRFRIKMPA